MKRTHVLQTRHRQVHIMGFQYNSGSLRKGESNPCSGTHHLCKAQDTSWILSCLIELFDIDPQGQATSNEKTLLYGCKMAYTQIIYRSDPLYRDFL